MSITRAGEGGFAGKETCCLALERMLGWRNHNAHGRFESVVQERLLLLGIFCTMCASDMPRLDTLRKRGPMQCSAWTVL